MKRLLCVFCLFALLLTSCQNTTVGHSAAPEPVTPTPTGPVDAPPWFKTFRVVDTMGDTLVLAGNGEERIVRLQGVNPHAGATGGRNGVFHFWKGTAYVRPFIWFGNWNRLPKKGAKLLVDGFSMEEVSAAQAVPPVKK